MAVGAAIAIFGILLTAVTYVAAKPGGRYGYCGGPSSLAQLSSRLASPGGSSIGDRGGSAYAKPGRRRPVEHDLERSGVQQGVVVDILQSLPHLLKLPSKHIWFDFDEEADVLYVSFERPQGATDTELTEDGVLLRYRGSQLVGVTILNARKRIGGAA